VAPNRRVWVINVCRITLGVYLLARGPQKDTHLFLQANGQPVTVKWLRGLFKKLGKKIGAAKFTPNVMRHTFITHTLRFGATIIQVAEFVGHKDLNTTMGYAKISFEQLVKTVNLLPKIGDSVPKI